MEFRTLKPEEIDVKVGNVTASGYTLLLYKNARVDMTILDETVGAENWQRDHKDIKGNLYCGIGINTNYNKEDQPDRWIWKWDCGVESQFGDKEKGESSDSFKRSAVNWGIGRELYTAPFIFIPCETRQAEYGYKIATQEEKNRRFKVTEIGYNDKREIVKLTIIDQYKTAWTTKNKNKENEPEPPKKLQGKDYKFTSGKYAGFTIGDLLEKDMEYLNLLLASKAVPESIKENILEATK